MVPVAVHISLKVSLILNLLHTPKSINLISIGWIERRMLSGFKSLWHIPLECTAAIVVANYFITIYFSLNERTPCIESKLGKSQYSITS
jgi:hypothetical protein